MARGPFDGTATPYMQSDICSEVVTDAQCTPRKGGRPTKTSKDDGMGRQQAGHTHTQANGRRATGTSTTNLTKAERRLLSFEAASTHR